MRSSAAYLSAGLDRVNQWWRATTPASAYARERRQGLGTGMPATTSIPIIEHGDVRRNRA
jgi:hypothetical protein